MDRVIVIEHHPFWNVRNQRHTEAAPHDSEDRLWSQNLLEAVRSAADLRTCSNKLLLNFTFWPVIPKYPWVFRSTEGAPNGPNSDLYLLCVLNIYQANISLSILDIWPPGLRNSELQPHKRQLYKRTVSFNLTEISTWAKRPSWVDWVCLEIRSKPLIFSELSFIKCKPHPPGISGTSKPSALES